MSGNSSKQLPPETNMLINSDGSTTVLLESMINCPLHVRVEWQRRVRVGSLPAEVRQVLETDASEWVTDRRSILVTGAGAVVSVNRVTINPPAVALLGSSASDLPIGHQLRRLGALQHRVLVDHGLTAWPLDSRQQPCAFKAYTISSLGNARIYVHETFNPCHVPVLVDHDPSRHPPHRLGPATTLPPAMAGEP